MSSEGQGDNRNPDARTWVLVQKSVPKTLLEITHQIYVFVKLFVPLFSHLISPALCALFRHSYSSLSSQVWITLTSSNLMRHLLYEFNSSALQFPTLRFSCHSQDTCIRTICTILKVPRSSNSYRHTDMTAYLIWWYITAYTSPWTAYWRMFHPLSCKVVYLASVSCRDIRPN